MAGTKGRSGRPRKPIALHVLDGTLRRDRHGDPEAARRAVEAAAAGPVPEPFDWLPAAARRWWRSVAPTLHRQGLLDELAAGPFAAVAWNVATMRDLERDLAQHGETYVNAKGRVRERPEAAIYRDAVRRFLRDVTDWGLSPRARAGLGVRTGSGE